MSSRGLRVGVAQATAVGAAPILTALIGAARRSDRLAQPVAIDTRRGDLPGAQWRIADPATPSVIDALTGIGALIWVAATADLQASLAQRPAQRREHLVRTAQTLVTASAAAGVGHLIVVTSATVYGAYPDNPLPLPESAPLRAERDAGMVGDLLAVEDLLAAARTAHPAMRITVVRPAALVGPGIDTVVTRHFEAPRLLAVKGATPAWQFCHVEDLAAAVLTLVTRGQSAGPVATVGCDGWLSQGQVQALSGMRQVQLTESAALGTAQRLHRVGVLPSPASELALVLHPWAIDSASLRALGWRAAYDNETCVGVLLENIRGQRAVAGRRVDRKDAALGAASAAVALVGTAAVLRRARRR